MDIPVIVDVGAHNLAPAIKNSSSKMDYLKALFKNLMRGEGLLTHETISTLLLEAYSESNIESRTFERGRESRLDNPFSSRSTENLPATDGNQESEEHRGKLLFFGPPTDHRQGYNDSRDSGNCQSDMRSRRHSLPNGSFQVGDFHITKDLKGLKVIEVGSCSVNVEQVAPGGAVYKLLHYLLTSEEDR